MHYAQEIPGGRTREDGRVLKWLISGIEDAGGRGRLPFFCGDLTPRAWRVSPVFVLFLSAEGR